MEIEDLERKEKRLRENVKKGWKEVELMRKKVF